MNQDISILFEDLKYVKTPPPMGGCMVLWVGWWMGLSFDILIFDCLLKAPQPITGVFSCLSDKSQKLASAVIVCLFLLSMSSLSALNSSEERNFQYCEHIYVCPQQMLIKFYLIMVKKLLL